MSTIALQPTQKISRRYSVTERIVQDSEKVLSDREKSLQSIAFLKQYMEDLKAGRPVENISPSNDPYYLVPANIADLIEAEEYLLKGGKCIRINRIEDLWED